MPEFDEKLQDFFEYLNFRLSDSVSKLNYYRFFEIFDEDFLIEVSPFEET